jgi:hypothetical protein
MHMRRGQQGVTLMGFVIVLIVLGFFAYMAMRLIPMYSEYSSISKALDATVQDPIINGADPRKIRDMISRHFETGYVDSVQPEDIDIKRTSDGVTLTVDYDASKPFIANLSLVGHFHHVASNIPGKAAGG